MEEACWVQLHFSSLEVVSALRDLVNRSDLWCLSVVESLVGTCLPRRYLIGIDQVCQRTVLIVDPFYFTPQNQ